MKATRMPSVRHNAMMWVDHMTEVQSVSVSPFAPTVVNIHTKGGFVQQIKAASVADACSLMWDIAYRCGLSIDRNRPGLTTRWTRS